MGRAIITWQPTGNVDGSKRNSLYCSEVPADNTYIKSFLLAVYSATVAMTNENDDVICVLSHAGLF